MKRSRLTALAALILTPLPAQQGSRLLQNITPRKQVALVIGNSIYTNFGRLKNPANDADAMARRLGQLNYDVLLVKDAGRRAMAQKVEEFIGRLGSGDVALFYYAGHGVQVEGENYLVPVDFEGQTEIDVRVDSYAVTKVQERMERSGAQLNILVLDACRNNPFRFAGRSGTRGWAAMSAGQGTFLAFATAPGSTASDNLQEDNGLFTKHLLEALAEPGLGLNDLFDYVRGRVHSASEGKQLPWTQSSVLGQYRFFAGSAAASAPPPRVAEPPPPAPRVEYRPPPEPLREAGQATGTVRENPRDGLQYVWIGPGRFRMGCSVGDNDCRDDEKPVREVEITRGFWMGQTEVTQAAFQRVTGLNPSNFSGPALPAETVRWAEASEYCVAVGLRLPTEAEWEYAARGGSTGRHYGEVKNVAWYSGNSRNKPHPAGQKQANGFGLYDMLGNVSEWVADWYEAAYYANGPARDPAGPTSGQNRVLRGGSWVLSPRVVRASYRVGNEPTVRIYGAGFRCAGEFR